MPNGAPNYSQGRFVWYERERPFSFFPPFSFSRLFFGICPKIALLVRHNTECYRHGQRSVKLEFSKLYYTYFQIL